MKATIEVCPNCESSEMELITEPNEGSRDVCQVCGFISNYVQFQPCNHCYPDIYGVCPEHDCNGSPTTSLCLAKGGGVLKREAIV